MPPIASNNNIAAAPKTKKNVEGFDAAAEILSHSFYAQILKEKGAPSASSAANNAFKELRTTFTKSLKRVKKKSSPGPDDSDTWEIWETPRGMRRLMNC